MFRGSAKDKGRGQPAFFKQQAAWATHQILPFRRRGIRLQVGTGLIRGSAADQEQGRGVFAGLSGMSSLSGWPMRAGKVIWEILVEKFIAGEDYRFHSRSLRQIVKIMHRIPAELLGGRRTTVAGLVLRSSLELHQRIWRRTGKMRPRTFDPEAHMLLAYKARFSLNS